MCSTCTTGRCLTAGAAYRALRRTGALREAWVVVTLALSLGCLICVGAYDARPLNFATLMPGELQCHPEYAAIIADAYAPEQGVESNSALWCNIPCALSKTE